MTEPQPPQTAPAPPVPPQPTPYPTAPTGYPAYAVPPAPAVARPSGGVFVVVGLALLGPALLALLLAYVVPTIGSIVESFQRKSPFGNRPAENVGLDNYQALFEGNFGSALGFTLLVAVPLVLTVVVAGPVVAWLAHRSGDVGRRVTRVALVPLLVLFSPVAVAAAWFAADRTDVLRDSPQLGVTWITWAILFGALLAVSVTVFLPVLRRRADEPRAWTAAIAVGALLGIAGLAYGLQVFDLPYVLTRGGRGTATLLANAFADTFMQFDLGGGAAMLTLVGIPLALLGVAAVLLVAFSGLRARWAPDAGRPTSPLASAAVIVVLLGCLAVVAYALWPWFGAFGGDTPSRFDAGRVAVNTWLPPLISTVVGVALAALAGFGIGALRPLGRFSELLLLPFAPWLFVTPAVQAFGAFEAQRDGGTLNTLASLIPPVWINIPALVLFTVLFRGLSLDWRAGRASLGAVIVPALPMAAVAVLATWLINAQSLMWPFVFANNVDRFTGPIAVYQVWLSIRGESLPVGLALPIAAIVAFALAVGALQWFYLDKLAIRAGRGDDGPA
ncbi:hypothetical protein GCM10009682_64020 [Luedemannella flava]|uniref:Sugar ABC transporter permease n=1 Tax=Luedemannella flava TaxID=349316 RepID=A0ABP4Z783_9ACTN